MAFLFKRSPKTPIELVKTLNEQVLKLDCNNENKKNQDECSKYIKQIKFILHGNELNEVSHEQVISLTQEIFSNDTLYHLIFNLERLDFETRKDVLLIFSTLLRQQVGTKSPMVEYLIITNPKVLPMLIAGPEKKEIGLICGQILRDCIKFEALNHFVLYNQQFWNFFEYVQIPIFEIATDSFTTLHDLLTTHKKLSSEFLANNYEIFTKSINQLIDSSNYVTKRQSVRLLSDLVLQRQNQIFLNKYFDDTINLKFIMMLMSNKLRNLQVEGFHIFKFFVAKPKKTQKVLNVLIKNKKNFIKFFESFNILSFNDSNLVDERDYILSEIQKLPDSL